MARLNRVALGNLGDVKSVDAGVSEFRLVFGKGQRVYFTQERDIREAKAYLQDDRRRGHGKKSSDYRKSLIERLKKDPEFQIEYLKASLEKNSDMPDAILMALRDIAEARGFEQFAEAADLSQKSFIKFSPRPKTLSHALKPSLNS